MKHIYAYQQAVAIFHQGIGQIRQTRLLALALAGQSRILIGGRSMCIVAAFLTTEVTAIAVVQAILGAETAMRGSGFQQAAIHRKVLVADQIIESC
ncbi:hypothetical protein HDE76_000201 [Rhodanobacter sp. ANJX3]|nr:hypothetical protein [Rhodanobacter sp. ANJX3]NYE27092.1 hypothetical protein [Rhodanobacter sp. K2T2]